MIQIAISVYRPLRRLLFDPPSQYPPLLLSQGGRSGVKSHAEVWNMRILAPKHHRRLTAPPKNAGESKIKTPTRPKPVRVRNAVWGMSQSYWEL
jgi:hypothetical protein